MSRPKGCCKAAGVNVYDWLVKEDISDRTAKNDLALLVQVGRARKEGAGPATRYELVK